MRDARWSPGQLLTAHQSFAGSDLQTTDLVGTGTVSSRENAGSHVMMMKNDAPSLQEPGCLLELTEDGKKHIGLPGGQQLSWIEDSDEVIFTG
ncbi:hypothetical protein AJ80_06223 [Polytolypa hystricis UAMH7299]|uniref:Fumarylacetoacetase n=1 Tax=Polytolypa hystricis (strain UAMH7299) TaxID=1447883 RepID=A0A2B7XYR5_POLH7|nr:hypothetical protein AJ80_06223 [Polytolypa hystricis UAMH7299]